MDAIDNKATSSSRVDAVNEGDLANASAAVKEDSDSQIAEKAIQALQQEQLQLRVHDGHLPLAEADPAAEWDPWRIMVIRHP
jgi:hypothetical protein